MPADLAIHDWPLPYETRLARRELTTIDLVIIHCTELPDMTMTREFGERVRYEHSQTGNSGHYYIDTDGSIHRFVANERVAHHTYGYNPRSIGIEMSNIGRYPHWGDSRYQAFTVAYTKEQIDALLALLRQLAHRPAEPALHRRPRGSRPAPRAGNGRPVDHAAIAGRIPGRCSRGARSSRPADWRG
jgi:N-acetyl-anhydromuramyl-L-alanine amidase AmpD